MYACGVEPGWSMVATTLELQVWIGPEGSRLTQLHSGLALNEVRRVALNEVKIGKCLPWRVNVSPLRVNTK